MCLQCESGNAYDLNVSIFERLVRVNAPVARLTQQHRMRPEISVLPRVLAYPDLRDAAGVHDRAPFAGAQRNAFFVHHNATEGQDSGAGNETADSVSKVNCAEAGLVVAILQFVLQQGYAPQNVVVLTAYLGQLHLLRHILRDRQLQAAVGERDREQLAVFDMDDAEVRFKQL